MLFPPLASICNRCLTQNPLLALACSECPSQHTNSPPRWRRFVIGASPSTLPRWRGSYKYQSIILASHSAVPEPLIFILIINTMTEENYPGVFDRVKAIVTDGIVLIAFMFITSYIFSLFINVPDSIRIIAFAFIFLLYDPLFTSLFGGTIGHMMNGIRVKRESDETKNILFLLAIPRYIVKASLGWISLLTVFGNKKRKAIHDYMAGSVVVYANLKNDNKTKEDNS
jgi:uncharacterized RDD family membrane protein YckC